MQLSLPLDIEPCEETDTIFERIKTCKSLPVLSPLASNILKMCQSEETEASALADVIAQDPGMAAQILFMANSAYYSGGRQKIISIIQSVNLLGFTTIANLALSFCFYRLIKDVKESSTSAINHVQYWRRSILASIAARAIGKHIGHPDTELMFLSALLQDIGILALNEVATEELIALQVHDHESHSELSALELEHLGVDHSQVGAWLAQQWELPEEFQVAILFSHTPELFETPPNLQTLVDVVSISSLVADMWMVSHPETAIDRVREKSQGRLTIQTKDWEAILKLMMEGIPQIASFFQTRLGNFEDITHIQHLALKHLTLTTPSQAN